MGRLAKTNAAVAAEPRGESPPPVIRGTKMVSALEERLGRLMQENDWSGGELLRKAFALVEVAAEAREQGNRLGIITKDHQVLAEVIAL